MVGTVNDKPYDDSTIMPNGKYEGERMIDIPPNYLLWIYENATISKELRRYIEDNMQALKEGH